LLLYFKTFSPYDENVSLFPGALADPINIGFGRDSGRRRNTFGDRRRNGYYSKNDADRARAGSGGGG
jgi:hypothetical protein